MVSNQCMNKFSETSRHPILRTWVDKIMSTKTVWVKPIYPIPSNFICGKFNKYRFIETVFKFRKSCFDNFGNVLVYNLYESTFRCRNLSNCKKVTPSQYCYQLTDFTY